MLNLTKNSFLKVSYQVILYFQKYPYLGRKQSWLSTASFLVSVNFEQLSLLLGINNYFSLDFFVFPTVFRFLCMFISSTKSLICFSQFVCLKITLHNFVRGYDTTWEGEILGDLPNPLEMENRSKLIDDSLLQADFQVEEYNSC